MIEGQKDLEAWEVDKWGEWTPWLKKKSWKIYGGYRNEIVQEEGNGNTPRVTNHYSSEDI